MGTTGYIVYGWNNRCYARYKEHDAYPSGLGLELLAQIPRTYEAFVVWVKEKRAFCESIDNKYNNPGEKLAKPELAGWRIVDRQRLKNVLINWVYEMNLDNGVFMIDGEPMYALQNMPSDDLFLNSIDVDHYGFRSPSPDLPHEHHFTAGHITSPPDVPEDSLLLFADGKPPVPPHVLFDRSTTLSPCESTCELVMALWVGRLRHTNSFRASLLDIPMRDRIDTMSVRVKWLMFHVIQRAVCPIYHCSAVWSDTRGLLPDGPIPAMAAGYFWWPRKHICVRPSSHLHDQSNLQHAIAELIAEITQTTDAPAARDRPAIVYGVAFSMLKVAIIRVNTTNGGFEYTTAMDFLPDIFATTPLTPGITALVRLGNLAADDDVLYHRSVIHSIHHHTPGSLASWDKPKPFPGTFPLDILFQIANYISRTGQLVAFACASKATMTAALPWFKHPMLDDLHFFPLRIGWIIRHCVRVGSVHDPYALWTGRYFSIGEYGEDVRESNEKHFNTAIFVETGHTFFK